MNFSALNCNLFNKFYSYVLNKKYGIGNGKISYKDLLFSYLNVNSNFLSIDEGDVSLTAQFIGVITQDNQLLPPNIAHGYYINDQDAFDSGIPKNSMYFLSQDNTYGMPFGTPKKLVEDVD